LDYRVYSQAGADMITGVHAVIFTADAERGRAFFRNVLELPSVDARGGWLIFALPPAELAAPKLNSRLHAAEACVSAHDLRVVVGPNP
jgi:catechol 2,3-dioxygenase-like lactoylglutathione lyase family enzyme